MTDMQELTIGKQRLILGDCREVLPTLPAASIDATITDPPYPGIKREYGYWEEDEWHELMHDVVREVKRLTKPTGSAVFVLQPNFKHRGQMRLWLWEFVLWAARYWNLVQDVYWWNYNAMPTRHTARDVGLLRGSVKHCVWLGASNCYRKQEAVLWSPADATLAAKLIARHERSPSGYQKIHETIYGACRERGGVTPYNIILSVGGRAVAHGAPTPHRLCDWWLRYICPPDGTALDPFAGSGTLAVACELRGIRGIHIEKESKYFEIMAERVRKAHEQGSQQEEQPEQPRLLNDEV